MISKTPLYNLMVILRETGLTADVLRVWERRYGLPRPQRTAGRHRLYSDYDIATVKWLKNRQAEGFSISRAAQLWKELMAAGKNPLEDAIHVKTSSTPAQTDGMSMELLREQWLEGCLSFDTVKAEEALNQAFALFPVEMVCDTILRKGLNTIGEQWYLGRISVQQEHFASSLAIRRLETLISATPQATLSKTVLVGCPPGEMHTFPVLLLSLFLQRAGINVVYLGADVPIAQLDAALDTIQPDLVVLSAQQLVTAANLSSAVLAVREWGVPMAYGGLIFNQVPELRKHVSAAFLGEDLETAVEKVKQLLQASVAIPLSNPDEKTRELAQLFRRFRPLIEKTVYVDLEKSNIQIDVIEAVNVYFSTRLAAALDLGSLSLLEGELKWIDGLLTSHHISRDQLRYYLSAYKRAVDAVLRVPGEPITRWIEEYLSLKG